ncbi:hypothetical protein KIN20_030237 [Parelaphostrongylus tenuis]|uniref:Uncharacterized protein n=1 Tax=Parelaphostrongylus tenuis TaxID=148309 RepID=A0AAD5R3S8_PARTN|nr:hypothetical protein KIN20_030237 [Parelaphostrongylus tenuis]
MVHLCAIVLDVSRHVPRSSTTHATMEIYRVKTQTSLLMETGERFCKVSIGVLPGPSLVQFFRRQKQVRLDFEKRDDRTTISSLFFPYDDSRTSLLKRYEY